MCFAYRARSTRSIRLWQTHSTDLRSACGPRAERLDLDGAFRGFVGCQPVCCIAAGIACLWGPAHGGANEAVLNMLEEIGSVYKIPEFIAKVKDKNSRCAADGFWTPRVQELRSAREDHAADVLRSAGRDRPCDDPLRTWRWNWSRSRCSDPLLLERKLYPNVDFYSGIILRAMGIPTEMFTVIFALARTVGWISQWKEMIEDTSRRLAVRASSNFFFFF